MADSSTEAIPPVLSPISELDVLDAGRLEPTVPDAGEVLTRPITEVLCHA